jgi:hypothetical protein
MKAIIGTAVGVLGLGGLVIAASGRTTVDSPARSTAAGNATVVDCGEGRQALVHQSETGASRVQCVAAPAAEPQPLTAPFATSFAGGPTAFAPVAPVVQERVVYRDRPAARTASTRRAAPATYSEPAPVYREPQRQTRSWKKSAVIIGGATAGGAGVGAILDGKSGAKKGAVVGLVGGTVYDIATRNR